MKFSKFNLKMIEYFQLQKIAKWREMKREKKGGQGQEEETSSFQRTFQAPPVLLLLQIISKIL